MLSKLFRAMALILLVAAVASSAAFAAPLTSNTATMPASYSTGAHGTPVVPLGKSPTTGLDFEGPYRPVMVQISNDGNARPHWNMSEADIVYEALNWAPSYTRYTAIYSDNHPDYVGSIRSARLHHVELREEWDAPFVFFGGQKTAKDAKSKLPTDIYVFMNAQNVPASFRFDGTSMDGTPQIYRDSTVGRDRLHACVLNLEYLVNNMWPTDDNGNPYEPKVHAYNFSQTPTRGQDTAVAIDIPYDDSHHHPSYTFNASQRVYERWYNGEEMFDGKSGKRIVASNVIVQYAKLEYYNGNASMPIITTTKGGVMDAYIDGTHIRGSWVRNTFSDRTIFLDAGGNEITLLPGKTFIQIVPESFIYTYENADGTVRTLDMGSKVEAAVFDANFDSAEMEKME